MAKKYGPHVTEDYLGQIEEARNELRDIIVTQNCAPMMLRLAFNDAGTYDKKKKTGGANGTVRMELNNPSNEGLRTAVDICEQVKVRHPKLTYADIYQLAGVAAVEAIGGPVIKYSPGRRDAGLEEINGEKLPSPHGDAQNLRTIFYRMGFSNKDIVVLSGSLALGRPHDEDKLDVKPLKFDNSYYIELIKNETPELEKFPVDQILYRDPKFRKYVQLYAQDKRKYFEDYAKTHKKMTELGVYRPSSIENDTCLYCIMGLLGVI